MAAAKRIFAFAFLAPAILLACSSDDNGPGPSDASDGGGGDATRSDAMEGGGDETRSGVMEGGGDGNGDRSPDANLPDGTTTAPDSANGSGMDAQDDGAVGCPTAPYVHVSTFNAILDGWVVANNSSPNLVSNTNANDGAVTGTLLQLDPNVGYPDSGGSTKLTIPFSQPGEQLLFAFLSSVPLNLTGERVTAEIRLDSGLNTSPLYTGSAFLALKSTMGYIYAQGTPTFLDPTAGFVTLSLDANSFTASTPGYTTCDIREIDVIIQTGNMGTYTTAVVHIDTIAVGPPGSDVGAHDSGPTVDAAPDGTDGASEVSDGASEASDGASEASDGVSDAGGG